VREGHFLCRKLHGAGRKFACAGPKRRAAEMQKTAAEKKTTAVVLENDRSGFGKRPQSFFKMTALVLCPACRERVAHFSFFATNISAFATNLSALLQ